MPAANLLPSGVCARSSRFLKHVNFSRDFNNLRPYASDAITGTTIAHKARQRREKC